MVEGTALFLSGLFMLWVAKVLKKRWQKDNRPVDPTYQPGQTMPRTPWPPEYDSSGKPHEWIEYGFTSKREMEEAERRDREAREDMWR